MTIEEKEKRIRELKSLCTTFSNPQKDILHEISELKKSIKKEERDKKIEERNQKIDDILE